MTTRLHIARDLALLPMMSSALIIVGREPVWIAGLATIGLALTASWMLREVSWRRSG